MLQTQNLSFKYPNGPRFSFPDLEVGSGKVLLVLGRSGVGKTTLLHLLAGLMLPQSGAISVDGKLLGLLSGSSLDRFRGKNIGIIFQQPLFVRSVNVMQNLLLARSLAGLPGNEELVKQLLTELDIANKVNNQPDELSIGERQRASIARAVITQPKIVLADEPTSALDDENCDRVANLLEETVLGNGASLIIVTHDHRLKNRFVNRIEL